MNHWIVIGIWVAVVGIIFAFLWKQGYLARLRDYIQETKVELSKCSWPTWDELKGSTIVVAISIALLGVFTVLVDVVFFWLVNVLGV